MQSKNSSSDPDLESTSSFSMRQFATYGKQIESLDVDDSE